MTQAGWTKLRGALGGRRNTAGGGGTPPRPEPFALVRRPTHFQDIRKIEQHLPEIMGRAMARGWIDGAFARAFATDPKGLLAHYNVFLPDTIEVEIETTESQRQRIVVNELRPDGSRRRVMYLQLMMMAGR